MSIDRPENLRDFRRIIIGIDPGTNVMGYGVLGVRGRQPEVVALGALRFKAAESHYLRLRRIHEDVLELVARYLPDEMAIEAPFFGKNVQSMLKLGRAQGVAIAAAIARDIPIAEYAPLTIKQSVTGSGSADKQRVATMLKHLLSIPDEKMPHLFDATDALGAAVTHFYESAKPAQLKKGASSWEAFLKQHPDRVAPRRQKPE